MVMKGVVSSCVYVHTSLHSEVPLVVSPTVNLTVATCSWVVKVNLRM